jgi:hypothetical protein
MLQCHKMLCNTSSSSSTIMVINTSSHTTNGSFRQQKPVFVMTSQQRRSCAQHLSMRCILQAVLSIPQFILHVTKALVQTKANIALHCNMLSALSDIEQLQCYCRPYVSRSPDAQQQQQQQHQMMVRN